MTAASVHIIFKSVVVAKLVYAASSWWGFATADDRKRLQAVIRRGIRSGLCEQHHKTVEELVEEADDKLFTNGTSGCTLQTTLVSLVKTTSKILLTCVVKLTT